MMAHAQTPPGGAFGEQGFHHHGRYVLAEDVDRDHAPIETPPPPSMLRASCDSLAFLCSSSTDMGKVCYCKHAALTPGLVSLDLRSLFARFAEESKPTYCPTSGVSPIDL